MQVKYRVEDSLETLEQQEHELHRARTISASIDQEHYETVRARNLIPRKEVPLPDVDASYSPGSRNMLSPSGSGALLSASDIREDLSKKVLIQTGNLKVGQKPPDFSSTAGIPHYLAPTKAQLSRVEANVDRYAVTVGGFGPEYRRTGELGTVDIPDNTGKSGVEFGYHEGAAAIHATQSELFQMRYDRNTGSALGDAAELQRHHTQQQHFSGHPFPHQHSTSPSRAMVRTPSRDTTGHGGADSSREISPHRRRRHSSIAEPVRKRTASLSMHGNMDGGGGSGDVSFESPHASASRGIAFQFDPSSAQHDRSGRSLRSRSPSGGMGSDIGGGMRELEEEDVEFMLALKAASQLPPPKRSEKFLPVVTTSVGGAPTKGEVGATGSRSGGKKSGNRVTISAVTTKSDTASAAGDEADLRNRAKWTNADIPGTLQDPFGGMGEDDTALDAQTLEGGYDNYDELAYGTAPGGASAAARRRSARQLALAKAGSRMAGTQGQGWAEAVATHETQARLQREKKSLLSEEHEEVQAIQNKAKNTREFLRNPRFRPTQDGTLLSKGAHTGAQSKFRTKDTIVVPGIGSGTAAVRSASPDTPAPSEDTFFAAAPSLQDAAGNAAASGTVLPSRGPAKAVQHTRRAGGAMPSEAMAGPFSIQPSVLEWDTYVPGQVLTQVLTLRNTDSVSRHVRLLPPATQVFFMDVPAFPGAKEEHAHNNVSGVPGLALPHTEATSLIAPGMAVKVTVTFAPPLSQSYQDNLTVLTESGTFAVPLIGSLPPPNLTLPPLVDLGSTLVYDLILTTITVQNVGGASEFRFVPQEVFALAEQEANSPPTEVPPEASAPAADLLAKFLEPAEVPKGSSSILPDDIGTHGDRLCSGPFLLWPRAFFLERGASIDLHVALVPRRAGLQTRHLQLFSPNGPIGEHVFVARAEVLDVGLTAVENQPVPIARGSTPAASSSSGPLQSTGLVLSGESDHESSLNRSAPVDHKDIMLRSPSMLLVSSPLSVVASTFSKRYSRRMRDAVASLAGSIKGKKGPLFSFPLAANNSDKEATVSGRIPLLSPTSKGSLLLDVADAIDAALWEENQQESKEGQIDKLLLKDASRSASPSPSPRSVGAESTALVTDVKKVTYIPPPSVLRFENIPPGTEQRKTLTITNNSSTPIAFFWEVSHWEPEAPILPLPERITVPIRPPSNQSMPPNGPVKPNEIATGAPGLGLQGGAAAIPSPPGSRHSRRSLLQVPEIQDVDVCPNGLPRGELVFSDTRIPVRVLRHEAIAAENFLDHEHPTLSHPHQQAQPLNLQPSKPMDETARSWYSVYPPYGVLAPAASQTFEIAFHPTPRTPFANGILEAGSDMGHWTPMHPSTPDPYSSALALPPPTAPASSYCSWDTPLFAVASFVVRGIPMDPQAMQKALKGLKQGIYTDTTSDSRPGTPHSVASGYTAFTAMNTLTSTLSPVTSNAPGEWTEHLFPGQDPEAAMYPPDPSELPVSVLLTEKDPYMSPHNVPRAAFPVVRAFLVGDLAPPTVTCEHTLLLCTQNVALCTPMQVSTTFTNHSPGIVTVFFPTALERGMQHAVQKAIDTEPRYPPTDLPIDTAASSATSPAQHHIRGSYQDGFGIPPPYTAELFPRLFTLEPGATASVTVLWTAYAPGVHGASFSAHVFHGDVTADIERLLREYSETHPESILSQALPAPDTPAMLATPGQYAVHKATDRSPLNPRGGGSSASSAGHSDAGSVHSDALMAPGQVFFPEGSDLDGHYPDGQEWRMNTYHQPRAQHSVVNLPPMYLRAPDTSISFHSELHAPLPRLDLEIVGEILEAPPSSATRSSSARHGRRASIESNLGDDLEPWEGHALGAEGGSMGQRDSDDGGYSSGSSATFADQQPRSQGKLDTEQEMNRKEWEFATARGILSTGLMPCEKRKKYHLQLRNPTLTPVVWCIERLKGWIDRYVGHVPDDSINPVVFAPASSTASPDLLPAGMDFRAFYSITSNTALPSAFSPRGFASPVPGHLAGSNNSSSGPNTSHSNNNNNNNNPLLTVDPHDYLESYPPYLPGENDSTRTCLRIQPATGVLPPKGIADVIVTVEAGSNPETLRTMLRTMVFAAPPLVFSKALTNLNNPETLLLHNQYLQAHFPSPKAPTTTAFVSDENNLLKVEADFQLSEDFESSLQSDRNNQTCIGDFDVALIQRAITRTRYLPAHLVPPPRYLRIVGDVQAPILTLTPSHLPFSICYVGVPVEFTLVLENFSSVEAPYSLDPYVGKIKPGTAEYLAAMDAQQEKDKDDEYSSPNNSDSEQLVYKTGQIRMPKPSPYLIRIKEGKGTLGPKERRELTATLVPIFPSFQEEGLIGCSVLGLPEPLGVQFRVTIIGALVGFSLTDSIGTPLHELSKVYKYVPKKPSSAPSITSGATRGLPAGAMSSTSHFGLPPSPDFAPLPPSVSTLAAAHAHSALEAPEAPHTPPSHAPSLSSHFRGPASGPGKAPGSTTPPLPRPRSAPGTPTTGARPSTPGTANSLGSVGSGGLDVLPPRLHVHSDHLDSPSTPGGLGQGSDGTALEALSTGLRMRPLSTMPLDYERVDTDEEQLLALARQIEAIGKGLDSPIGDLESTATFGDGAIPGIYSGRDGAGNWDVQADHKKLLQTIQQAIQEKVIVSRIPKLAFNHAHSQPTSPNPSNSMHPAVARGSSEGGNILSAPIGTAAPPVSPAPGTPGHPPGTAPGTTLPMKVVSPLSKRQTLYLTIHNISGVPGTVSAVFTALRAARGQLVESALKEYSQAYGACAGQKDAALQLTLTSYNPPPRTIVETPQGDRYELMPWDRPDGVNGENRDGLSRASGKENRLHGDANNSGERPRPERKGSIARTASSSSLALSAQSSVFGNEALNNAQKGYFQPQPKTGFTSSTGATRILEQTERQLVEAYLQRSLGAAFYTSSELDTPLPPFSKVTIALEIVGNVAGEYLDELSLTVKTPNLLQDLPLAGAASPRRNLLSQLRSRTKNGPNATQKDTSPTRDPEETALARRHRNVMARLQNTKYTAGVLFCVTGSPVEILPGTTGLDSGLRLRELRERRDKAKQQAVLTALSPSLHTRTVGAETLQRSFLANTEAFAPPSPADTGPHGASPSPNAVVSISPDLPDLAALLLTLPSLSFGALPVGGDPLQRTITLRNQSPCPIILRWRLHAYPMLQKHLTEDPDAPGTVALKDPSADLWSLPLDPPDSEAVQWDEDSLILERPSSFRFAGQYVAVPPLEQTTVTISVAPSLSNHYMERLREAYAQHQKSSAEPLSSQSLPPFSLRAIATADYFYLPMGTTIPKDEKLLQNMTEKILTYIQSQRLNARMFNQYEMEKRKSIPSKDQLQGIPRDAAPCDINWDQYFHGNRTRRKANPLNDGENTIASLPAHLYRAASQLPVFTPHLELGAMHLRLFVRPFTPHLELVLPPKLLTTDSDDTAVESKAAETMLTAQQVQLGHRIDFSVWSTALDAQGGTAQYAPLSAAGAASVVAGRNTAGGGADAQGTRKAPPQFPRAGSAGSALKAVRGQKPSAVADGASDTATDSPTGARSTPTAITTHAANAYHPSCVRTVSFANPATCPLSFTLSTTGPFVLLQPHTKASTGSTDTISLSGRESFPVTLAFHLDPSAASNTMAGGASGTVGAVGIKSLRSRYTGTLEISFAAGGKQSFPLAASVLRPSLSLSKPILDVGTVRVHDPQAAGDGNLPSSSTSTTSTLRGASTGIGIGRGVALRSSTGNVGPVHTPHAIVPHHATESVYLSNPTPVTADWSILHIPAPSTGALHQTLPLGAYNLLGGPGGTLLQTVAQIGAVAAEQTPKGADEVSLSRLGLIEHKLWDKVGKPAPLQTVDDPSVWTFSQLRGNLSGPTATPDTGEAAVLRSSKGQPQPLELRVRFAPKAPGVYASRFRVLVQGGESVEIVVVGRGTQEEVL